MRMFAAGVASQQSAQTDEDDTQDAAIVQCERQRVRLTSGFVGCEREQRHGRGCEMQYVLYSAALRRRGKKVAT